MPCDCKDSCCSCTNCSPGLAEWWKKRPPFEIIPSNAKVANIWEILPAAYYKVFHPRSIDFKAQTYQGDKQQFAQPVQLGNSSSPLYKVLITNFTENFSAGTCCTEACLPAFGCPYPSQDYTLLSKCVTPVVWPLQIPRLLCKSVCELPTAFFEVCGTRGVQVNREVGDRTLCCNGADCTCNCCCVPIDTCRYRLKPCSSGGNCGTCWPLTMYVCGLTSKTCIQLSTEPEGSVRSACNSHAALGVASIVGVTFMAPLTTAGFLWGGSIAASYLVAPCFPAAATTITTTMTFPTALTSGLACIACDTCIQKTEQYLARNGICTFENQPIIIPGKFAAAAKDHLPASPPTTTQPPIVGSFVSPKTNDYLVVSSASGRPQSAPLITVMKR